MIHKSLVFLVLFFTLACSSTKQNSNEKPGGDCLITVSVKDFTGLDGCSMLLVTSDGKKLLPMEAPADINWKPGEKYKIGYTAIDDALSICMAENEIIKVSCAEKLTVECKPSQNGRDNSDLKSRIDNGDVQRIIRYEFDGSWVYQINRMGTSEFIDCQGVSLCQEKCEKFSECFKRIKPNLTAEKIIYQGEGPQE